MNVSSPEPGKWPESILYYHQHQSTCREILLKVWSNSTLSSDQKEAISDWVIGRLWKGLEEIFHLLQNPLSLPEAVAFSQYRLISIAFNIMFQELQEVRTTTKHSSKYLHWLYDHFLHIHWELNPEVKLLVTQSLVKFFVDMMDDVREQPYQRLFLELSSSLLVKAPLEISEALLSDDKMKVLFKDYLLLEEGSLESLEESEHRLIQYVREFDPHTALTTTLRRIVDQRVWELNDLVLIYIALSEPLDRSLIEILRQAIMHLDFSRWLEEKDFTLACLTLAQCANASNDIEVQNRVMEKLTDAWVRLARQMAQYNAILSATIIVIANSIEEDKATEFYKWWREAIERMQGQIPEEIYEIAVSLAWRLRITQRQGLWDIKSRLAVLM